MLPLTLRTSNLERRSPVLAFVALSMVFGFVSGMPAAVSAAEVRDIVLPIHRDHVDEVYWSDTYGAPRSGGRSHIGVDMMGPKMVPLVAVADGTVTWMRHDSSRGNNLEITDADGWSYHYVHINNDTPGTDDGANAFEYAFAPGIERGATVRAGQVVAYLGDSGNAEWTGSHLHFEISRPDGTPINPTASVDAARVRLNGMPEIDPAVLTPYTSLDSALDDVLTTLTPGSTEYDAQLELAYAMADAGLAGAVATYVDVDSRAAAIDRLYFAVFLRLPDFGGFQYWIDRDDLSQAGMADFFADSAEYRERYADLDFADFLDQLYLDVLGRNPDEGGKAYWLKRLADPADPVTRGTIVAFFTDSDELRELAALRSEIVALTALFEDRMPRQAEIDAWTRLRGTTGLVDAIEQQFVS